MKKRTMIVATAIALATGTTQAAFVVGSAAPGPNGTPNLGNGNFEGKSGAAPGANTTWAIAEINNWHNISGAETQSSGTNQGMNWSPQGAGGYGAYLFPSFILANDQGHTVAGAGEIFKLNVDVFGFGGAAGYDGDTKIEVNLFTTAGNVVDGTTATWTDVATWSSASFGQSETANFNDNIYTTTAGDAGKTLFMGVTLSNTSSGNAFPRIDTVSLEVIPEPSTIGLVGLSGGFLLYIRRKFSI